MVFGWNQYVWREDVGEGSSKAILLPGRDNVQRQYNSVISHSKPPPATSYQKYEYFLSLKNYDETIKTINDPKN